MVTASSPKLDPRLNENSALEDADGGSERYYGLRR
jgi:hypothetical protein